MIKPAVCAATPLPRINCKEVASMLRKKLTEVAVDSFTDYLKDKLEYLKTVDLDKDGTKDIDQIISILNKGGVALKEALDSTDFTQMASGLEQIVGGVNLVKTSFDATKVQAVARQMKEGAATLADLAQLGIVEMKQQREKTR
jgi:hypothetical protein